MKLAPKESWEAFSRSKELIDHVFALSQNHGWHYMSFTTNTMIAESSRGGTIYLGLEGESVVEAVISEPLVPDAEFEGARAHFVREFNLTETE